MFSLNMKVEMMLPGESMATKVTSEVFDLQVFNSPVSFEVMTTTRTGATKTLTADRAFQVIVPTMDY